jgi:hypothetical protein
MDECAGSAISSSPKGEEALEEERQIAMRKSQILGLALFAVFAFSAIMSAAAFAESEWLLNGAPITAATEVLSEGELSLCDDKGGLFGEDVCVKCSGLDKGTVGPGKADVTQEVTGLAGEKDITNCTNELNCPSPILVEAENLPWTTEIVLNGTEFRDLIGTAAKQPGYLVSCAGVVDLCEGHATVTLTNEPGGVLATFANLEVATCTRGGAGQGLVTGTSLIFDHVGELSVS